MARLPVPQADAGTWGDVLNDFLLQAHATDGTIKSGSITEAQLSPAVQTKLNSGPGAVTSVNGQQGAVVLNAANVGADPAGSAATAQSNANSYTNTAVSGYVPTTRTVNGEALSANIVLDKSDIGLGNVDNTSDINKPISTAVQTALNTKADASAIGAKVLLIDTVGDLPPGTPANVVVVVKS